MRTELDAINNEMIDTMLKTLYNNHNKHIQEINGRIEELRNKSKRLGKYIMQTN